MPSGLGVAFFTSTSKPLMVVLPVLMSSLTTCSCSNVMKQNPFRRFFSLSIGISTSTTVPMAVKWSLMSSSVISGFRPPTKILPWRLRLLGVHLLTADDMVGLGQHLFDGVDAGEDEEREAA